jgi:drug/metabolite transporter (DMT)-like permease
MALGTSAIDVASFTSIRLASGAATLLALASLSGRRRRSPRPPWRSALALFAYALSFSFAYQILETGTGALVLFGSVQATMLGAGLVAGERPRKQEWVGLVLAAVGLVYLVFPAPTGGGAVISLRLLISGSLILGGVALASSSRVSPEGP